jgi:hypothetical protein
MAPEEVLLFLKKLSYAWEPTVWEVRDQSPIQEGVVEVIFLGVEETSQVVEEEAVTQIR